MSISPPRSAARLLARALRNDPAGPAILGDLHEELVRIARKDGEAAARRWYWREACLLSMQRLSWREARAVPGTAAMESGRVVDGRARGPGGGVRALLEDAGYALRVHLRAPGFALFTAALIGLGVGGATTVFSVLRPLALAPLPFPDAHELVWIANEGRPGDESLSAVTSRTLNLADFRERSRSFDGLTGYNAFFDQNAYTLTGAGEPERLVAANVAHDFLDVLGVETLHGRSFTVEEGLRDGPDAAILTHAFWRQRFAADPGVVGRAITLNDTHYTVVGVLPPTFDFSSIFTPGVHVDVLLPFVISTGREDFQGNVLAIMGRLQPGVTPAAAQAELEAIIDELAEEDPRRWGLGARVTPLQQQVAGPFHSALLLLAAAAGTLLLIVCVNVSNLILSRSPSRAREVAVRKAFGASRFRLARQLLLESLGVSILGALLGSGLAWGITSLVARSADLRIPLLNQVGVDGSALLFAAGAALLTGLVVGIVPALQVREGTEAATLRASASTSSSSRRAGRLREVLVIAEVTLACVLVASGGLLIRSFRGILDIDLGFDPSNTVAWQINPGAGFVSFDSPRERADYYRALTDRVSQVPGVEQVGLIDALPLGRNRSWNLRVVEGEVLADTAHGIYPHMIDAGYLGAMRVPLVTGRGVTRDDTEESQRVVLLNESGARQIFGGENPLGRRIRVFGPWVWEVVGLVRDVKHLSPEQAPGIQVYFPITQMPDYATLDLVVRSSQPVARIAPAVGETLRAVDAALPTREFWTVESTVDRAVSARRFTLSILTAYGAAALLLAALGVYGVLSQAVAERKAEIGIRIALGASHTKIVGSVMRRVLLLAGLGIMAGLALSLVSNRLLDALLFQVSPRDPVTLVGTVLVLLLVAGLAGALPAIRAGRVRGVGVLRGD
jgi:predicted permease